MTDTIDVPPPPPLWLTADAMEHWDRLAPMACEARTLTGADYYTFGILCESCADMTYLQKVIREEGLTIAGADKNRKAHPALRQLESCRANVVRLLEGFGLTAKSRRLVRQEPEPPTPRRFGSLNGPIDPERQAANDEKMRLWREDLDRRIAAKKALEDDDDDFEYLDEEK